MKTNFLNKKIIILPKKYKQTHPYSLVALLKKCVGV